MSDDSVDTLLGDALDLMENNDHKTALESLLVAAKLGDSDAMVLIGEILTDDNAEVERDYAAAIYWYEEAIKVGDIEAWRASLGLARMYLKGKGIRKNVIRAYEILESINHPDPRINMVRGRSTMTGEVPGKSIDDAIDYFTDAYDNGNWLALRYTAILQMRKGNLYNGFKNFIKSIALMRGAILNGESFRMYGS